MTTKGTNSCNNAGAQNSAVADLPGASGGTHPARVRRRLGRGYGARPKPASTARRQIDSEPVRRDYVCMGRDCEHTFAVWWTEAEAENDETPYCPVCQNPSVREIN